MITSLKSERDELLRENQNMSEDLGEMRDQNNELETRSQKIESENQMLADELSYSKS